MLVKETIMEESKTIKVSKKEKNKHLKSFNIKIVENKTGKELLNHDTDCLLGVFNSVEKRKNDVAAIQVFSICKCDVKTRIFAIESLKKLREEQIRDVALHFLASGLSEGDNE